MIAPRASASARLLKVGEEVGWDTFDVRPPTG